VEKLMEDEKGMHNSKGGPEDPYSTRRKTLAVKTVLWVGTHMPTRNLETVFSLWIYN
jgi:hypothetical protein